MPARHTSLQDGLLLEADFTPEALVDERGCRRDIRSNGWIVFFERSSLFSKTGPAEETSFLRSVRIYGPQFHRQFWPVQSDPDVFADALVPQAGALMPGAVSKIPPKTKSPRKNCRGDPGTNAARVRARLPRWLSFREMAG